MLPESLLRQIEARCCNHVAITIILALDLHDLPEFSSEIPIAVVRTVRLPLRLRSATNVSFRQLLSCSRGTGLS